MPARYWPYLLGAFILFAALPSAVLSRTVDEFEGKKKFAESPGRQGSVRLMPGEGSNGSQGLVFEGTESTGKSVVCWNARLSANEGIVFRARSPHPEKTSIQTRFVEKDGDAWIAWFAPKEDWEQYGAPFYALEFIPSGDGMRNVQGIERLELLVALQGGVQTALCYLDDVAIEPAKTAESVFIKDDYVLALMGALERIPLQDRTSIENVAGLVYEASSSQPLEQLNIFKQNLGPVLEAAMLEIQPLTNSLTERPPDESSTTGRTARQLMNQANHYLARLHELQRRLANYRLTHQQAEQVVMYSARALQMLSMAEEMSENGAKAEPRSPASFPSTQPTHGKPLRRRLLLSSAETSPTLATTRQLIKRFGVPADWSGSRILLSFESAGHMVEVFVNGIFCGSHVGGFSPFKMDITKAARFGQDNDMRIVLRGSSATAVTPGDPRVDVNVYPRIKPGRGPNAYLATGTIGEGDCWLSGPLWLESRPLVSLRFVSIETSVEKNKIKLHALIENRTNRPINAVLHAHVFDGPSATLELPEMPVAAEPGGEIAVEVESDWNSYTPWGPNEPYGTPHLYDLRLQLKNEIGVLDESRIRFGFRDFSIRSTTFLLNGKPILLKGFAPSKMPEEKEGARGLLQEVQSQGFNLLCVISPAPQWIFDLCDEMGMLCIVQSPIKGMVDVAPPDLFGLDDYSDPMWRAHAAEQIKQWAEGHVNHPSIILRVSESSAFAGDHFWAHGGGSATQSRKMREALDAAFFFDSSILEADPSIPVVHLDNAYAAGDRRFQVLGWIAPFASEQWQSRSRGRPVIAEILPAIGNRLARQSTENRQMDVLNALEQHDMAAILLHKNSWGDK